MSLQKSEKCPRPTSNVEFAYSRHPFDNFSVGFFCLYRAEKSRSQRLQEFGG